MLSQHLEYLKVTPDVDLPDYAYTLQHRRSTLPYRKAISATTKSDAINALATVLNPAPNSRADIELSTRYGALSRVIKVLGIFTGQGARWPRMAADLIECSSFATSRINDLDAALQTLPNASERRAWMLKDQLLAPKETFRIAEAVLS